MHAMDQWSMSDTRLLCVLQIVTSAIETQNVVVTCAGSELMKNMLPHLLEQLELCQKSLSVYLETKRAEFPRYGLRALCITLSICLVPADV
jgi:hypothetical protein